jgi:hypothetical protein
VPFKQIHPIALSVLMREFVAKTTPVTVTASRSKKLRDLTALMT